MKHFSRRFIHSLSMIAICVFSSNTTVMAGPTNVETSPLFLTSRAEPNVFLMVDNSGSMRRETITNEDDGEIEVGSRWYNQVFGPDVTANYTNNNVIPWQSDIDAETTPGSQSTNQMGAWRGRTNAYNKMFYDPFRDYEVWRGFDDAGTSYDDLYGTGVNTDKTAMRVNPYLSGGGVYDLSTDQNITTNINGTSTTVTGYPASFYVWDDTNGDGVPDPTETEKLIKIDDGTTTQCAAKEAATLAQMYTAGCTRRTQAEEMKNFAIWFSYHRSRDLAAKYAISKIISDANGIRMGFGAINEGAANLVQLPNRSLEISESTTNKKALFDATFKVNPGGMTPLPAALDRVGKYYSCVSGGPDFNGLDDSQCGLDKTPPTGLTIHESPAACSQNFAILISDGVYNQFITGVGNTDGSSGQVINDVTYIKDGASITQDLNFGGYEPYADGNSNTLADIAMKYYSADLDDGAGGIANKVPTECGKDENPAQHMVTYTMNFGLTGNLNFTTDPLPPHPKLGYASNCTADAPGADYPWAVGAVNTDPERIDDMVHAAYNGRGVYSSAQDAEALATSLKEALDDINDRVGSVAAVAVDSSTISTDSTVFFAKFNSANWAGEFSSLGIDANGDIFDSSGNPIEPGWDAHILLEGRSADNRDIVTYNRQTRTAFSFKFDKNTFTTLLNKRQQADLNNSNLGTPDLFGIERVNYIRGDHSCEITTTCTLATDSLATGTPPRMRLREIDDGNPSIITHFKLGDIVHSTPVYVGAPPLNLPGTDPFGANNERYIDFKNGVPSASNAFATGNTALNRKPMVYVGGNDGMLHAFLAEDANASPAIGERAGDEVWAYIPDALYQVDDKTGSDNLGAGLSNLTHTTFKHNYYVDLSPTVADAYIKSATATKDWHTVLVGGLRAGGRGYFAIDVTDPNTIISAGAGGGRAAALASKVMWEFSYLDDPDLGLSYAEPQIVPLGTATGIEYYVVIGNGYASRNGHDDFDNGTPHYADIEAIANHYSDTTKNPNPFSSKLFILKLEGPGAGKDWKLGTDYWKFDTQYPTGTGIAENLRNGMSTPVVADSDGDFIADRVYAGDLEGRLWAFDVTGTDTSWHIYQNSGPTPLFTATDSGGNTQPITVKPSLAFQTSVGTILPTASGQNFPNLMVYFGTGSYLEGADLTPSTTIQSFYGVWDDGEFDDTSTSNAGHTRSNLVEQTLVNDTFTDPVTLEVTPTRAISSPATVNYASTEGWFMDFPANERVVVDPIASGSLVFFKTTIPSADACGFGGSGWNMFVDGITGGPAQAPLGDYNGNGSIGDEDKTDGDNVAVGTKEDTLIFDSALLGAPKTGGPGTLICDAGFEKKSEIVTLSDGTTKTSFYCIPSGAKTGRFSWRELRF